MKLFYLEEAQNWNEALPVGNGFLGGMIFGAVEAEIISLNEDSVWSGQRENRHNPDTLKHLPKIRELLFEGRISEAEKLAELAMFSPNPNPAHYEPLGNLKIKRAGHSFESIKNYERTLDLTTAITSISYELKGVRYKQEVFASYKDQVLVIQLRADQPGSISLEIDFERDRNLDTLKGIGPRRMFASGQSLGEKGVGFATMYQLEHTGGEAEMIGGILTCKNVDTATILLCARTDVRDKGFARWCEATLDRASNYSYQKLQARHLEDYQSLYNRVTLQLKNAQDKEALPTNQRLALVKKGEQDNGLLALYFQFGRYLLISSSRPGSFPANLQGIWNKEMLPPWGSKYTININAQMNYWLAENCNLSELHEPLFDLLMALRKNGTTTAKEMYGCRGFVAHHNTDIFGDSAPVDKYMPATIWMSSVPWLCTHIWEQYQYTKDEAVLKKYYETIKEACLFFIDFLIEDQKGRLVASPSLSPENTYLLPNGEFGVLCYGASMDSQIISQLFSIFLTCSQMFSKDEELAQTIATMQEKLAPIQIGKHGQIMEWAEDYEEAEPGHRHISHLFALYPGDQISPVTTPELAKAARTTLNRRLASGGGYTGWSRAWIINFWARLWDGEKVYENLMALLADSTLPNLFDDHPPFQIDGNFGATAGIAEMLLQSHEHELHILPALSSEISTGRVTGLCARGGFEVDLAWEEGYLKKMVILSKVGNTCSILISADVLEKGDMQHISFKTEREKKYEFSF